MGASAQCLFDLLNCFLERVAVCLLHRRLIAQGLRPFLQDIGEQVVVKVKLQNWFFTGKEKSLLKLVLVELQ